MADHFVHRGSRWRTGSGNSASQSSVGRSGQLRDAPGLLVRRVAATAVIGLSCIGCSWQAPTLNAVLPATGYPRQLLAVDGATQFASVVWDEGLPSETILYNGLFGTSYFQIPTTAAAGPHTVAIRNSQGTSATVQVTVLPHEDFRDDPTKTTPYFPQPRIEDIGVLGVAGSGPVDVLLTVAAANLDVDATVTVAEIVDEAAPAAKAVKAATRWGALPVDYLQAHQPSTFGYPVYHYSQMISVVEGVALGSTLQVTVTNTDGKSDTSDYVIPSSLADLDGDGDGLLDAWEAGGYPAPSGNMISLKDLGTHIRRKDILVEVDWISVAQPKNAVWPAVEKIFADAPVLNPDGSRGVSIIIDRGQGGALSNGGETLVDHDCLTYDPPPAFGLPPACTNTHGFFSYKATNFDPDRLHIFHYAIFGRGDVDGQSGRGERHGNDFYITLLGSGAPAGLLGAQVGTFVHELGHNLGFSHGDLVSEDQNYPFKPNLPSVMGYTYTVLGVYLECDLDWDGVHTYSQGTMRQIDEANVDETVGLCDGMPADLNLDGDTLDTGPMNINPGNGQGEDQDTEDKWDDFDQWGSLLLDFDAPGSAWANN